MSADSVLRAAKSVVVIDWPSRDVPESLVRAGYAVVVKGGPGPDTYARWDAKGGVVATHPPGGPPAHADLVYAYRPLAELSAVLAIAQLVGAGSVWLHLDQPSVAEIRTAQEVVEAAGLTLVVDSEIAARADALSPGAAEGRAPDA